MALSRDALHQIGSADMLPSHTSPVASSYADMAASTLPTRPVRSPRPLPTSTSLEDILKFVPAKLQSMAKQTLHYIEECTAEDSRQLRTIRILNHQGLKSDALQTLVTTCFQKALEKEAQAVSRQLSDFKLIKSFAPSGNEVIVMEYLTMVDVDIDTFNWPVQVEITLMDKPYKLPVSLSGGPFSTLTLKNPKNCSLDRMLRYVKPTLDSFELVHSQLIDWIPRAPATSGSKPGTRFLLRLRENVLFSANMNPRIIPRALVWLDQIMYSTGHAVDVFPLLRVPPKVLGCIYCSCTNHPSSRCSLQSEDDRKSMKALMQHQATTTQNNKLNQRADKRAMAWKSGDSRARNFAREQQASTSPDPAQPDQHEKANKQSNTQPKRRSRATNKADEPTSSSSSSSAIVAATTSSSSPAAPQTPSNIDHQPQLVGPQVEVRLDSTAPADCSVLTATATSIPTQLNQQVSGVLKKWANEDGPESDKLVTMPSVPTLSASTTRALSSVAGLDDSDALKIPHKSTHAKSPTPPKNPTNTAPAQPHQQQNQQKDNDRQHTLPSARRPESKSLLQSTEAAPSNDRAKRSASVGKKDDQKETLKGPQPDSGDGSTGATAK